MQELDISDELWREYIYNDGLKYRIEAPQKLFIKDGGTGHRVLDTAGIVHWVPINTWFAIRWAPKNVNSPVAF